MNKEKEKEFNIWFTADLHLGHKNILQLSNRPFDTIEEHDKFIIDNYNKLVQENDVVYILGDISWCQSYDFYKDLFTKLKGNKYVVIGNHDNKQNLTKCYKDGLIKGLYESKTIQIGSDRIFLSHYPYREWSGFYKNAYHIYAHTHCTIEDYKLSTDCGCDCWEYGPVNWIELKKYIDNNGEPNVVNEQM
jgi:calcineurin-like phosphoesterase family protein